MIVFLIWGGIAACATPTPKKIPTPIDSRNSGVGITLRTKSGLWNSGLPDKVYFVRLEKGSDAYLVEVVASNYTNENRFYCLSIMPGRYAVVAAYTQSKRSSFGYYKHTTYFSEKIIKLTEVTVNSGELAYMGDYIIEKSWGLGKAGNAQKHYSEVMAGGMKSMLSQYFSRDYQFKGSIVDANNDEESKKIFFMKAKEDFKDSYWSTIIPP